jgi:rare lipoprotein A
MSSRPVEASPMQRELGVASYYAQQYNGKKTASGEPYNMHEMTAAHRRLPFGTRVRVTNLNNNSSVVVRINDRGPFVRGRVIDVSLAAARKLEMVRSGVAKVEIVPVSAEAKRSVATVP